MSLFYDDMHPRYRSHTPATRRAVLKGLHQCLQENLFGAWCGPLLEYPSRSYGFEALGERYECHVELWRSSSIHIDMNVNVTLHGRQDSHHFFQLETL